MCNVYQVITGNWLPNSKRIFHSFEDCKQHIKTIIDMKEEWVTSIQLECSIRLTMINTKELPEYRKIFGEYPEIKIMKRDQYHLRHKKRPTIVQNELTATTIPDTY